MYFRVFMLLAVTGKSALNWALFGNYCETFINEPYILNKKELLDQKAYYSIHECNPLKMVEAFRDQIAWNQYRECPGVV